MTFPPDIAAQIQASVQSEFSQLWLLIAAFVGVVLFFWSGRQVRGMFLSGKRNTHING